MKKVPGRTLISIALLCPIACVCFCISGCGSDNEAAPDLSVHFADANLEAAVRCAINKTSGSLYPWDLTAIDTLPAQGCTAITDVSSLGGIEYCTGLIHLYLQGNNVSDITLLSRLTHLSDLNLESNSIIHIDALQGLTGLSILKLGDNSIEDIAPLDGLANLFALELQGNHINDIGPLAGLVLLNHLRLDYNRIVSDISNPLIGIEDLINLTELHLESNQITEVGALLDNSLSGGLGEGDTVYLDDNPLSAHGCIDVNTLRARNVTVICNNCP